MHVGLYLCKYAFCLYAAILSQFFAFVCGESLQALLSIALECVGNVQLFVSVFIGDFALCVFLDACLSV